MSLSSLKKEITEADKSFTCEKLRVLQWEANSCYMDSVFFALFATPNPFLEKITIYQRYTKTMDGLCGDQSKEVFDEFKKELMVIIRDMRASMQSKKVCRTFRAFLRKHEECSLWEISPTFSDSRQHEAFEFLQFLLSVFGIGRRSVGAQVAYRKRYGVSTSPRKTEWKEWFGREDKKYSLVHRVPYDEFKTHRNLSSYLNYRVKDFSLNIKQTSWNGEPVNSSEEHVILQKFADCLILSLERENPQTGVVDHEAVQVPQKLTDCDGKSVFLDAVILHLGKSVKSGHYVCFKRCGKEWVLMDDTQKSLVVYKTWSEALQSKLGNIRTHGVLYFYSAHE
jgi:uncharacterized UBP type Zn finger protein